MEDGWTKKALMAGMAVAVIGGTYLAFSAVEKGKAEREQAKMGKEDMWKTQPQPQHEGGAPSPSLQM